MTTDPSPWPLALATGCPPGLRIWGQLSFTLLRAEHPVKARTAACSLTAWAPGSLPGPPLWAFDRVTFPLLASVFPSEKWGWQQFRSRCSEDEQVGTCALEKCQSVGGLGRGRHYPAVV